MTWITEKTLERWWRQEQDQVWEHRFDPHRFLKRRRKAYRKAAHDDVMRMGVARSIVDRWDLVDDNGLDSWADIALHDPDQEIQAFTTTQLLAHLPDIYQRAGALPDSVIELVRTAAANRLRVEDFVDPIGSVVSAAKVVARAGDIVRRHEQSVAALAKARTTMSLADIVRGLNEVNHESFKLEALDLLVELAAAAKDPSALRVLGGLLRRVDLAADAAEAIAASRINPHDLGLDTLAAGSQWSLDSWVKVAQRWIADDYTIGCRELARLTASVSGHWLRSRVEDGNARDTLELIDILTSLEMLSGLTEDLVFCLVDAPRPYSEDTRYRQEWSGVAQRLEDAIRGSKPSPDDVHNIQLRLRHKAAEHAAEEDPYADHLDYHLLMKDRYMAVANWLDRFA